MNTLLTVTVPFFALILFGYVAARQRWVPIEAVPAFNGFLLYFAVPAMLFRFASTTPFHDMTNGPFFAAWSIAGLCTLCVVVVIATRGLGARLRDAAFYGLAGSVSNVGYLGIPLLVALLGERAAASGILATIADQIVMASAGLALAQAGATGGRGWMLGARDAVVRAALNPFLISMFAGAWFSAFGWRLPTPASEIVRLLADAAGPCALFAIGVSLRNSDASPGSHIVALPVAGKLLLHPLAVWVAMLAFGIDPFTMTVATLIAALPTASWVFIFARRYDADAGRVSATILLTTALAFVTFSALAWALRVGIERGVNRDRRTNADYALARGATLRQPASES